MDLARDEVTVANESRPPAGVIRLTYDDYARMPEDGRRYELEEGVLVVVPSASTEHQRVSRNLQRILDRHVHEHALGEVFSAPYDVVLSPHFVYQPDLLFVSAGRAGIITELNVQGAPDLVVEIISPASAERDRREKAQGYARHGVRYYWLLDPQTRTLEEYRLEGNAYRLVTQVEGAGQFQPELFPGLNIELNKVWA